jgi:FkbM family methyltransferase
MIRKIARAVSSSLKTCQPNNCADPARLIGRMAVRNRYDDINFLLANESPVIVDGGANNGSTTEIFLQSYRSPIIHAFEPIPELVNLLNKKFRERDNVFIHGAAIGSEEKTISFNILNNLVSSSVLNPSELKKSIHGDRVGIRQVVQVPQVRLDRILGDVKEIDLLKLDLQGYELEALKGCGSLLERVKVVVTEIEFIALYKNQPLFGDVDVFLRGNGFNLYNLYDLYTQENGQLTAGDAVYINSKYQP